MSTDVVEIGRVEVPDTIPAEWTERSFVIGALVMRRRRYQKLRSRLTARIRGKVKEPLHDPTYTRQPVSFYRDGAVARNAVTVSWRAGAEWGFVPKMRVYDPGTGQALFDCMVEDPPYLLAGDSINVHRGHSVVSIHQDKVT